MQYDAMQCNTMQCNAMQYDDAMEKTERSENECDWKSQYRIDDWKTLTNIRKFLQLAKVGYSLSSYFVFVKFVLF